MKVIAAAAGVAAACLLAASLSRRFLRKKPETQAVKPSSNVISFGFKTTDKISRVGHRIRRLPSMNAEQVGTVLGWATPTLPTPGNGHVSGQAGPVLVQFTTEVRQDGSGCVWGKLHPDFCTTKVNVLTMSHQIDTMTEGWVLMSNGSDTYFDVATR